MPLSTSYSVSACTVASAESVSGRVVCVPVACVAAETVEAGQDTALTNKLKGMNK